MSTIAIIGSGFAGLSAASYLSAAGHQVHVFEKNAEPGGRARQLKTDNGYVFDMGPSWYWMPDVFERFFNDFGYSTSDFYNLKLIDPSFEMLFDDHKIRIPANFEELCALFESIENGAAQQLKNFMLEAEYKYKTGIENLIYKPGLSYTEFADMSLLKGALRLQVFSSFSKHVRKYFSHPALIALMEFPVLFLGAMPQKTPALYSLMNYAGLKLGTWYPEGGFGKIIDAMVAIAENNGTNIYCHSNVQKIDVENNRAKGLIVDGEYFECDAVVAAADYHHVEKDLLSSRHRNYTENYWDNRTMSPSCLIFYVGVNKRIDQLQHHTLFFDEDLHQHSIDIYEKVTWPTKPLFYICCPSKSDDSVAPKGHENLFFLMPIAPGLKDSEEIREKYYSIMLSRLEKHIGQKISDAIDYKRSYCIQDFILDYNSYKGNAYGLANTLMQTSVLKPKIRNKKVKNLFYAGQLTVPGPGVPPAIISGKISAEQLLKHLHVAHEVVV